MITGRSKYIQAPDIVWNKPFKAKVFLKCMSVWWLTGWLACKWRKEFTKGGNFKPWVVCSWAKSPSLGGFINWYNSKIVQKLWNYQFIGWYWRPLLALEKAVNVPLVWICLIQISWYQQRVERTFDWKWWRRS